MVPLPLGRASGGGRRLRGHGGARLAPPPHRPRRARRSSRAVSAAAPRSLAAGVGRGRPVVGCTSGRARWPSSRPPAMLSTISTSSSDVSVSSRVKLWKTKPTSSRRTRGSARRGSAVMSTPSNTTRPAVGRRPFGTPRGKPGPESFGLTVTRVDQSLAPLARRTACAGACRSPLARRRSNV